MHDITRREVFAGVFIQRFIKLPYQLLEDSPHRGVVDPMRMQVHVLESLQHLEQQTCLVELADGVVEVELFEHLPHVRAEASNVIPKVRGDVGGVGEEFVEIVARRVVEGETGSSPELGVQILQPLTLQFRLPFEYPVFRVGQYTVEPPQNGEGQDDVLVFSALEGIANQVRNTPEKTDDLAMVHCVGSPVGNEWANTT